MSSEFDEVAKAIAKNMPRRKILKLFAGGVAAAVGSALVGSTASAQPYGGQYCEPQFNQTGFNGNFYYPDEECGQIVSPISSRHFNRFQNGNWIFFNGSW